MLPPAAMTARPRLVAAKRFSRAAVCRAQAVERRGGSGGDVLEWPAWGGSGQKAQPMHAGREMARGTEAKRKLRAPLRGGR